MIEDLIQYGCDEAGCPELAQFIRVEWNARFSRRIADCQYIGSIKDPCPRVKIRFSTKLWPSMSQEDREDTVLHEVAHAIDSYLNGNAYIRAQDRSGHGRSWQRIAIKIGAKSERYADDEVAAFAKYARKMTYYQIPCLCRIHTISKHKLTKMRKGYGYRCKFCHAPLNWRKAKING